MKAFITIEFKLKELQSNKKTKEQRAIEEVLSKTTKNFFPWEHYTLPQIGSVIFFPTKETDDHSWGIKMKVWSIVYNYKKDFCRILVKPLYDYGDSDINKILEKHGLSIDRIGSWLKPNEIRDIPIK